MNAISCPNNLFQFSTGQTQCVLCSAGNDCTGTSATGCRKIRYEQASDGDPVCQVAPTGYAVPDGITTSLITYDACQTGEYLTSGTCTQCPKGKSCDKTSATNCGAGLYSDAGWGHCANPPWGQQPDSSSVGGLTACSSPEYFDAATGTCKTCPSGVGVICDLVTGEQSTC